MARMCIFPIYIYRPQTPDSAQVWLRSSRRCATQFEASSSKRSDQEQPRARLSVGWFLPVSTCFERGLPTACNPTAAYRSPYWLFRPSENTPTCWRPRARGALGGGDAVHGRSAGVPRGCRGGNGRKDWEYKVQYDEVWGLEGEGGRLFGCLLLYGVDD